MRRGERANLAANREYELKFSIAAEAAERVVSHPLVTPALRHRQVSRLTSTYFDTPDRQLQRHRFGLRVRRSGHQVTHTLKQAGGSLVDRGEWEQNDPSVEPNIVWLRKTPLAPLLDERISLGPRFTVDVTRTTFPVRHGGARIELALDQGRIDADGVSLPVNELELEVKSGEPKAALALARALARDLPLTLSLASKSERGYAVSDLTWGRPDDAIKAALTKRMTIAEAFEAIIQACLHTFLKNVALIGGDADEEAVHKGRIALRHLRAACQLFRPALRRRRYRRLEREVKWLSGRLGAARDADVFQAAFFEPAAREATLPGGAALAGLMGEHRRGAHRRLRKALASPRARLLFLDVLAFSTDGVRRKMRARAHRPFVRSEFRCRHAKLAWRAHGVSHRSPAAIHDVRKAAKMLRYDLDLLDNGASLVRAKTARRLGKGLKALQKSLGLIQDEEAMQAHLRATVLSSARRKRFGSSEAWRQASFAADRLARQPISRAEHLRRAEKAARKLRV